MYGKRLNMYLPKGYIKQIDRLIAELQKAGVDLENEKHPGMPSYSKLFRYLIDERLRELREVEKP